MSMSELRSLPNPTSRCLDGAGGHLTVRVCMFLGIQRALCELGSHLNPRLFSFPYDIPPETAIPDWAYLGVGVRPFRSLRRRDS